MARSADNSATPEHDMDSIQTIRRLAPADLRAPEAFWREVEEAHNQDHRHYHTLRHIAEVVQLWAELVQAQRLREPWACFLALVCHDGVYRVGQKDNEARSAIWATQLIEGHLPDCGVDLAIVSRLIELTAEHGRVRADSLESDAQLVLDCDMAILGASPSRFAEYERDIEAEQRTRHSAWAYRIGRRRWIRSILECEAIYCSSHFRGRLEAPARRNLEAALMTA